jgi:hypothetical protein
MATRVVDAAAQQEFDDVAALLERCAETGEQFAYDPTTRKAEMSALRDGDEPGTKNFQVVEVVHAPAERFGQPQTLAAPIVRMQIPLVSVPPQRPRERRSRSRTRSAARGSPGDPDSDPESEPVAFIRGFAAAGVRLSRHLQRRTAVKRIA